VDDQTDEKLSIPYDETGEADGRGLPAADGLRRRERPMPKALIF
jgi:hypothetical protein